MKQGLGPHKIRTMGQGGWRPWTESPQLRTDSRAVMARSWDKDAPAKEACKADTVPMVWHFVATVTGLESA